MQTNQNQQWIDNNPPPSPLGSNKPNRSRLIKQLLVYVVVPILLFTAGWLLGDGRLKFSSGQDINSVALNSEGSELAEDLSTDGLQEIYDLLVQKYDGEIDPSELLDGLKAGAVEAVGDNFTEYLNSDETKEFNDDLNGTFEGIGAELSREGEFVVVVAPIKGTPADEAGIRSGDIIIEIDGEDSTGITVFEAVKRIRGEKGTEVVLTVVRDAESVEVPIVRGTIDIPSVEWSIDGNIGIIEVARFGGDTETLARKAATELKDQGATKIILDLRGNPGGLLDAAVELSSVWLEKGAVVLEEKRAGETIRTFTANGNPLLSGIETIVLIDEGSASSSEIVAGALKDNGAATLLGQKSFGKGSVQQLINLKSGGSLKVTIARWFTPSGNNIDKEGLTPDEEVEVTDEDRDSDNDPQLEAAKKTLN